MTIRIIAAFFALLVAPMAFAGWNPLDKETPEGQAVADHEVAETIASFKNRDPQLQVFFDKAYGYVVFPTVGKAAIGLGGAYGDGLVYEQGQLVGQATLTQVTIGFQLGGQAYSEIIFFRDKHALDAFSYGNYELNAQASAVALTAGAAANADYAGGVAIFTLPKGGLMYEVSVGGQKFTYAPLDPARP